MRLSSRANLMCTQLARMGESFGGERRQRKQMKHDTSKQNETVAVFLVASTLLCRCFFPRSIWVRRQSFWMLFKQRNGACSRAKRPWMLSFGRVWLLPWQYQGRWKSLWRRLYGVPRHRARVLPWWNNTVSGIFLLLVVNFICHLRFFSMRNKSRRLIIKCKFRVILTTRNRYVLKRVPKIKAVGAILVHTGVAPMEWLRPVVQIIRDVIVTRFLTVVVKMVKRWPPVQICKAAIATAPMVAVRTESLQRCIPRRIQTVVMKCRLFL